MNIGATLVEGLGTTVIGMGIVFVTLAVIAFVISLLKYIGPKETVVPKTTPKAVSVPKEQPKKEEIINENKAEDSMAVVAAITAAVAAMMNTSADKLRVVSIRKSDSEGWRNITKREQHRHIY